MSGLVALGTAGDGVLTMLPLNPRGFERATPVAVDRFWASSIVVTILLPVLALLCLGTCAAVLPASEVWVEDKAGEPIGNANVYFVYANGTYQSTTTKRSGFAKTQAKSIEPVTVVAGGPGLDGVVMTKVDSGIDKIQVKASRRQGGSVVFDNGTGSIPGLGGTLNPILDTLNRSYLYGRELSINDGSLHFRLPLRCFGAQCLERWGCSLVAALERGGFGSAQLIGAGFDKWTRGRIEQLFDHGVIDIAGRTVEDLLAGVVEDEDAWDTGDIRVRQVAAFNDGWFIGSVAFLPNSSRLAWPLAVVGDHDELLRIRQGVGGDAGGEGEGRGYALADGRMPGSLGTPSSVNQR